jgi:hypothetical protein
VELDPLGGVFVVSIEVEECVVKDCGVGVGGVGGGEKKQTYILYGKKGDAELFFNYEGLIISVI